MVVHLPEDVKLPAQIELPQPEQRLVPTERVLLLPQLDRDIRQIQQERPQMTEEVLHQPIQDQLPLRGQHIRVRRAVQVIVGELLNREHQEHIIPLHHHEAVQHTQGHRVASLQDHIQEVPPEVQVQDQQAVQVLLPTHGQAQVLTAGRVLQVQLHGPVQVRVLLTPDQAPVVVIPVQVVPVPEEVTLLPAGVTQRRVVQVPAEVILHPAEAIPHQAVRVPAGVIQAVQAVPVHIAPVADHVPALAAEEDNNLQL